MHHPPDIHDIVSVRHATGEAFVLATVVRTVSATAVKAGAKAVILPDGTVSDGWIGGGCARAAVVQAVRDALADGQPRLVSVQPPQDLSDQKNIAGIQFAANLCPSQGTMDIFVEPVLPRPQLILWGSSPVAVALSELATGIGFVVIQVTPASGPARSAAVEHRSEDAATSSTPAGARYLVVATQGSGDESSLRAALAVEAPYVAFVGSRKKVAAFKSRLAAQGVAAERLAQLKAPAGIDIGAITPEEIAVSVVVEIIAARRHGHARARPIGGANAESTG
jgi:xanthine dehydrogenase accessory factor